MKLERLKKGPVPKHLAIILDGNGRWAKRRALPRSVGHQVGANNIITIARLADEIGIKYLTVYAFSTENWKRSKEEVDFLMHLPLDMYEKHKERLFSENKTIRLRQVGRTDRFPDKLKTLIDELEETTKDFTGLTLNIAFDYGSYDELNQAIKRMIEDGKTSFTDDDIFPYLYVKEPVDLLIRTSGEQRLSNFLLYQASYAEFYFTKKHWPSFDKRAFIKAIVDYQKRDRRFGGRKE